MNKSGNQILITGGSDGIGKSLAKRFIESANRVIITGRNEEKLINAAREIPNLEILVNDIGVLKERERLAEYINKNMPDINVLINNAGIQRRVELAADVGSWTERQNEIDILLSAPIHLNHLLIPTILKHRNPSWIVNITSGGAFIPQTFAPVYSACKAALHSYTITLRHSLDGTNCSVVELIPPAVQTSLSGGNTGHGTPLKTFIDSIFGKLTADNITEIGYGPTENLSVEISGRPLTELFKANSQRFPIKTYREK